MNNTPASFDPAAAAQRLVAVHKGAPQILHTEVLPPDRELAFAVQDATVAALGGTGAWKVGAKSPTHEPSCAPLPARGVLASGAQLHGPSWRMRCIEVEVAVRLGRDLIPRNGEPDTTQGQGPMQARQMMHAFEPK